MNTINIRRVISIILTPIGRFPCLRRPFLRLRSKLFFIDQHLPNGIVVIVYLDLGRKLFLPLGRYARPPAVSFVSYLQPVHICGLPLPAIPAGVLTIIAFSRFGLPDFRKVPYHSTPLTPR